MWPAALLLTASRIWSGSFKCLFTLDVRMGSSHATEGPHAAVQPEEPARLGPDEVRRRATRGVALLAARGVAIRGLGFLGNVVLAQLLTPADFGAVAIGTVLIIFVGLVSDGGLGAALVRGDHRPTRLMFEQLLGLQLAVAVGVTLVVASVAPLFGRPGWITAIMTASFCISVFRTSGFIQLDRNLMFQQVAMIEVLEMVAYLVWAIGGVLLGAGVWALATASIARAFVATGFVLRIAPIRVLRPRFRLTEIRPLLSFGARFQAINGVNLIRDQGLNIGVAAVAGLGTLGVWSMAFRFIQVPFLLFESLWRVTFPAMARLIEAGEDPRPAVEKLLTRSSVLTGAMMCALVGATPALIPALFDPQWEPIVDVLPWACAGLLIGGPISVSVAGFLFANGDAGTALRGAVLHTIACLSLSLALLPVIGITALGLGAFASAFVEGAVLGTRAVRGYRIAITKALLVPTLVACAAGAAGWFVAVAVSPHIVGAIAGGAAALALFLVGVAALSPRALRDTVRMATGSLRPATV
jgi:O-antigen/teichoic acid export membrane protein